MELLSFNEVATWLQSASMAAPISQLSAASWALFFICGHSVKSPFNGAEQLPPPLSKTSFQIPNDPYHAR
ncbi:MAG TPA: hypothetical protein VLU91_02550 [Nitrososphaerales archaeon]|nr:hypothetical protein [Nitrososphaerales archaeon]